MQSGNNATHTHTPKDTHVSMRQAHMVYRNNVSANLSNDIGACSPLYTYDAHTHTHLKLRLCNGLDTQSHTRL